MPDELNDLARETCKRKGVTLVNLVNGEHCKDLQAVLKFLKGIWYKLTSCRYIVFKQKIKTF